MLRAAQRREVRGEIASMTIFLEIFVLHLFSQKPNLAA